MNKIMRSFLILVVMLTLTLPFTNINANAEGIAEITPAVASTLDDNEGVNTNIEASTNEYETISAGIETDTNEYEDVETYSTGDAFIMKHVSGGTGTAGSADAAAAGDTLTYTYQLTNPASPTSTPNPDLTGMTLIDPLDDPVLDLAATETLWGTSPITITCGGTGTGCPATTLVAGTDYINNSSAANGLSIDFGSTVLPEGNHFIVTVPVMCSTGATFDAADYEIDSREGFNSVEAGNHWDVTLNPDYYKTGFTPPTGGGGTGSSHGGSGGDSYDQMPHYDTEAEDTVVSSNKDTDTEVEDTDTEVEDVDTEVEDVDTEVEDTDIEVEAANTEVEGTNTEVDTTVDTTSVQEEQLTNTSTTNSVFILVFGALTVAYVSITLKKVK